MIHILTKIKHRYAEFRSFAQHNPTTMRYGVDGVLVLGAVALAASNNNIFAQRMGAGDYQLSLILFLPQMMHMLLLVPAGFFTDTLRNKQRMLSISMICAAVFFVLAGASAFAPAHTVLIFLVFLSMANVSIGMYNLSWQAYFPEVVEAEERNSTLAFRARATMLGSFLIPLISGGVLASIPTHEGKIAAHQGFYLLAGIMIFTNAFLIKKIKATRPAEPKRFNFNEIKAAAGKLRKNRKFMMFAGVMLFFHMTWHFDWTLYFIGQANYLLLNEFQLGLVVVGGTAAQFVTIPLWSRRNARKGVDRPVAFAIFGMALCPAAMVIATSMPASIGPHAFIIFHTTANLFAAPIQLNIFQCLLKVTDEDNRSFSISVYTTLITFSNAVMPVAGVALYRALGGDLNGLRYAFSIMFVLRLIAIGVWLLRCRAIEREEQALPTSA